MICANRSEHHCVYQHNTPFIVSTKIQRCNAVFQLQHTVVVYNTEPTRLAHITQMEKIPFSIPMLLFLARLLSASNRLFYSYYFDFVVKLICS